MSQPSLSKKTFFAIGGFFVFIFGTIAGSYLVLGSPTSRGEFVLENEPTESLATISGDIFSSLDLAQEISSGANEKNLTDDFLQTISRAGDEQELTAEGYETDEFFEDTVVPYFEENSGDVIPSAESFKVNTSITVNTKEYVEEMKLRYLLLAGAWQKIITTSPEDLEQENVTEELRDVVLLLSLNDKEMLEREAPSHYKSFHQKTLALSSAIKTILNDVFINKDADPLRALVVVSSLETVEAYAQSLVSELTIMGSLIN